MLHFDVVVIGSGPAGAAVAEGLWEIDSSLTIAIIERGRLLLRRHFYDSGASMRDRDVFIAEHGECPWDGDLGEGGMLLPVLGGRGIVGGSQLHRFYDDDFTLWEQGVWPVDGAQLDPYFSRAEARLLGTTRSVGHAQDFVRAALAEFGAQHPPSRPVHSNAVGLDGGFSHRSSAERILTLLDADHHASRSRVHVFTETVAIQLVCGSSDSGRVSYARCLSTKNSDHAPVNIGGTVFVLAASPVESARLVLLSDLAESRSRASVIGRYLAEHIYSRGCLDISGNMQIGEGPINVFLPPSGSGRDQRCQIELRSMTRPGDDRKLLRVTGSAAMDPGRNNRVTLSLDRKDDYGAPRAYTVLRPSAADTKRAQSMVQKMHAVAACLGGTWLDRPFLLRRGSSYHESGTLRISDSEPESAADSRGLLLGTANVFVGDGAAFACTGVANPILTLTAMGYRLAAVLWDFLGA